MSHYYLDEQGAAVSSIDEATVWASCEHDTGYGACRSCWSAKQVEWIHAMGAGRPWCDHDTAGEALAHVAELDEAHA